MSAKLKSVLRSSYAWAVVGLGFVFHLFFGLAMMVFAKDKEYAHLRATRPFVRAALFLNGISLRVEGTEHIPRDRTVMFLSNHLSLLDILAYIAAIPIKFAFVAKKELFSVPILGWDLRLQGHVRIDRDNSRSAHAQLAHLVDKVKAGKSLLIFAEGTRSPDGHLQPFKRGPFVVAQAAGVPLIPCAITGTDQVIKKHSLSTSRAGIVIRFGLPLIPADIVDPTASEKDQTLQLQQAVHDAVSGLLEKETP